jgi:hypothetical protein
VPDPRDEPPWPSPTAILPSPATCARPWSLCDRSDDADFRRLVDDVLHGRADLRDVYFTPAFAAGINPGTRQFAERWEQLGRQEQEQLAQVGREQLDDERLRLERDDDARS